MEFSLPGPPWIRLSRTTLGGGRLGFPEVTGSAVRHVRGRPVTPGKPVHRAPSVAVMTEMTLPDRHGEKPRTGPSVPHIQLTQGGPAALSGRLTDWILAELPGVREGPSEISDPAAARAFLTRTFPGAVLPDELPAERARAFFVPRDAPDGVLLMPPSGRREFAHLHDDGSLHLALPAGAREELLAAGWGEPHPFFGGTVNVTMLFGPRDEEELAVAERVVRAAYDYAMGH
jgi:hypothetical protein